MNYCIYVKTVLDLINSLYSLMFVLLILLYFIFPWSYMLNRSCICHNDVSNLKHNYYFIYTVLHFVSMTFFLSYQINLTKQNTVLAFCLTRPNTVMSFRLSVRRMQFADPEEYIIVTLVLYKHQLEVASHLH